jgi:transposase-like protein
MSEKRKYRTLTPQQKAEVVLAGLRGDRSVRDICPEHEIAETRCYQGRDRLLEARQGRPPCQPPGIETVEVTPLEWSRWCGEPPLAITA